MRPRAGLALVALVVATTYSACIALTVSGSYQIDVLTAADEVRLTSFGLSGRQVTQLGEDAGVLLSLVENGAVAPASVKKLAEALAHRSGPTQMQEYPVDPERGTVQMGSVAVPLPNDRPLEPPSTQERPIWRGVALGPGRQTCVLPPEPPRVVSQPLGPFPYPDGEWPYRRGACWKLVSAPAQWEISALVGLPAVEGLEEAVDPLGAYMYFGLEAPGVVAIGGLVWNASSASWEAFLWGGQVSGAGGWKQCRLPASTPAGATLLLVFGLGADKDEYELRIYDPADWQMIGWFRDQLAPSEFAVDRDNFGVQLRCVTGLATQSGPLPEGARLKDGRWTSLALCGWDSISGVNATPRWSHVTVDNTIGPISYPAGLVSEDVRLPDIRLSLGG